MNGIEIRNLTVIHQGGRIKTFPNHKALADYICYCLPYPVIITSEKYD